MKVSTIITTAAIAFLSTSAFAANTINHYESAIAAEVIVRQVIDAQLLKGADKAFNVKLKRSLVGSGRSMESVSINKIECDRTVGTDQCVISFSTNSNANDPAGDASSFELHTTVREGKVSFAKIDEGIG